LKKLNLAVDVIVFFLGALMCWASLQMRYGKVARPGPGFLPFWCGALISIISLALFLHQLWKKNRAPKKSAEAFQGVDPLQPIAILGAMILYGLLYESLGFLLSNFLFLPLIFRLVWKKRWGFILIATLLMDIAFYLLFQELLQVQLPKGVLGYLYTFL